jgi:hypothetical protein
VLAETGFIDFDESHLPDRRSCLQLVQSVRAFFPAQTLHPFRDGAARNQHNFVTGVPELRDLLGPARQCRMVKPLALVGDQSGTDFNDQSFGVFQNR